MKKFAFLASICIMIVICVCACTAESAYSEGTYDGSSYENDFTNISFTLPEDYSFTANEDLNLLDVMDENKLAVDYHMYAHNEATMESVIIAAEDMSINGGERDAETYLTEFAAALNNTAVLSTMSLGVETYSYIDIENGSVMQRVLARCVDNWVIVITITSTDIENVNTLCAMFS